MAKILLIVGGLVQVVAAALHVGIFYGIASNPVLPAAAKPTAHIFNAAVLTTAVFFAYVSLFRTRDLLNTGLGRIVCLYIGVFYLQGNLVEMIVRGLDPVRLGITCAVAALYFVAPFATRKAARRGEAEGVDNGVRVG
jgi:hypothetical protein